MRRWLVLGLLLLGFARASTQDAPPPFAAVLPSGVADVSGWEVVSGEFETTRARGAYRFRVNPARQAIYQLMRYRVQLLDPGNELERARRSVERVVFVRRPGAREPLLCWEREPPGASPAWRVVPPRTDEYNLEMAMVMQVLEVHRAARAGASR